MSSTPPLVSVVIPAWNAEKWLDRAIESVLRQDYPRVEMILVDDGSTDATREVCAKYAGKLRYCYQTNCGVSAARNRGVAQATGEVVVFLDADDELCPQALSSLAAPLKQDPSVGGVSGILLMKGSADHDFFRPPKGILRSGRIPVYSISQRYLIGSSGTGIAVRKSAFEAVGGFTEGLHFGEDSELCNKIYGRYNWYFIDEHVATYHRSSEHSVTCRTPYWEHGFDALWTESQMRAKVDRHKWPEYRQYQAMALLTKARLGFRDDQRDYGQRALQRFAFRAINLRYCKWKLIYLLPPLLWRWLRAGQR